MHRERWRAVDRAAWPSASDPRGERAGLHQAQPSTLGSPRVVPDPRKNRPLPRNNSSRVLMGPKPGDQRRWRPSCPLQPWDFERAQNCTVEKGASFRYGFSWYQTIPGCRSSWHLKLFSPISRSPSSRFLLIEDLPTLNFPPLKIIVVLWMSAD